MDNYVKYTTVQGDTFDLLAYKAYGSEFLAHLIIQANPSYANVIIFDAGVILSLPKIKKELTAEKPPWR